MEELKELLEGKKLIHITIEDKGDGIAELKQLKDDSIVVQWVLFTSAYPSQVYGRDLYEEEKEYKLSEIYRIEPCNNQNKT